MIKKADILLGIFLFLLCLLSFFLLRWSEEAGQAVTITVDGALYGSYDLSQDQQVEIRQESSDGGPVLENIVEIRDGVVFMKESTCANHVCIEQGGISRTNQTIVCLPNHVVVSLTGSGSRDGVDAFSY